MASGAPPPTVADVRLAPPSVRSRFIGIVLADSRARKIRGPCRRSVWTIHCADSKCLLIERSRGWPASAVRVVWLLCGFHSAAILKIVAAARRQKKVERVSGKPITSVLRVARTRGGPTRKGRWLDQPSGFGPHDPVKNRAAKSGGAP